MIKTEKQQKIIDCLFDEDVRGDLRSAMNKAGYAEKTPLRGILDSMGEDIEKAVREFIARSGAKAAFSMTSILTNPVALGNKSIMVASKDILDRAGFAKTDKIEITTESPLFILPPKD
jgi:hypothetical protein